MEKYLNGRLIRLSLYVVAVTLIYLIPIDFIEKRSFCLWYNIFNIRCIGCGMTRAFFNLSRLDIVKAIIYNPLIIFMVVPITFIIRDIAITIKLEVIDKLKNNFKNKKI